MLENICTCCGGSGFNDEDLTTICYECNGSGFDEGDS